MLSNYEKSHKFVANEIFFLGAPNKTGTTIESMDRKLLALNYYSDGIIDLAQPSSMLERMAITYIISKVFNLGNCERQSFALFMHMLHENHFAESLEIILIDGESILGPHRFVVADRNQTSHLNDLGSWHNAAYLDTWSNEIISGKELTSLTKEQLANKGLVSGNVELTSIYRRQSKLSKSECLNLISFLTEAKSNISHLMLQLIKLSYPDDLKDLLLNLDDEILVNQIHTQISKDISIYKTMALNTPSGNENRLIPTMPFFQENQTFFDRVREQAQLALEQETRSIHGLPFYFSAISSFKTDKKTEVSAKGPEFFNPEPKLDGIEEQKLNFGNICLSFVKDEYFDYSLQVTQDGIKKEGLFVSAKLADKLINAKGDEHIISILESSGKSASKIALLLREQQSSLNNAYQ